MAEKQVFRVVIAGSQEAIFDELTSTDLRDLAINHPHVARATIAYPGEDAPQGKPPPRILPSVVRSGVMPKTRCAPPSDSRKPVITSSKIRMVPWREVTSRIVWR